MSNSTPKFTKMQNDRRQNVLHMFYDEDCFGQLNYPKASFPRSDVMALTFICSWERYLSSTGSLTKQESFVYSFIFCHVSIVCWQSYPLLVLASIYVFLRRTFAQQGALGSPLDCLLKTYAFQAIFLQ